MDHRSDSKIGAQILGSDKARGYCREMIWADFLAGAGTEENQLEVPVVSLERLYQTLPDDGREQLRNRLQEGLWKVASKTPTPRLKPGGI